MKNALLAFAWAVAAHQSVAQDSTKTHKTFVGKSLHAIVHVFDKEEYGKNIIRYNPIPTVLFSEARNFALGYERVLGKNQSISINLGQFYIPQLLGDKPGFLDVEKKNETGLIASLDYRFYIKKLNTRSAPNGVYIGPYYSLQYHKGTSTFSYVGNSGGTSTVNYDASLSHEFMFNNVGFEIGYQFIFFKRISLDLVFMGPSVSFYNIELGLNSNLSSDQAKELYEKYYDSFFSKYPIIEEVYKSGTFEKKGSTSGIMPNFRYLVQVGYHF